MVKIVVESEDLIFTFRVYYQVEDALAFASEKASLKDKKISPFLCHDFIREYCNLTAGAAKKSGYKVVIQPWVKVANWSSTSPIRNQALPSS